MAHDHVRVRVNVVIRVWGIWIVHLCRVYLGQHIDVREHTRLFIESKLSMFALLALQKKLLGLYLRSVWGTSLLARHIIIVIKIHFERELLNKRIVEFLLLLFFHRISGFSFENAVMNCCILHLLVLFFVILWLFDFLDLQLRSSFIALRISAWSI